MSSIKFSELSTNESLFLSKLSEIDEDIGKFDFEISGKGGTPLSEGKWTQLMKTAGTNSSQLEEVLICGIGKRSQDDSRVLLELPGKRH
nr:hypothetical protein CFP56_06874 [Quercus suber]